MHPVCHLLPLPAGVHTGYGATSHAGRHNPEIAAQLFPDKSSEDQAEFSEVKEAYFRTLASSGVP